MGRGESVVAPTKGMIPGNSLNLKHMVDSFELEKFLELPDVMDFITINGKAALDRPVMDKWKAHFERKNEPYVVLAYPGQTKQGESWKLWKRRVAADK